MMPMNDWIEISPDPLSTDAAVRFVTEPAGGGINVFVGTTRAETRDDGQALAALDYEAYPEMAAEQMRDLAQRARVRWPLLKIAILHRIGRVDVGSPSVVIAVSTAHRAAAFTACHWLIDSLKAEVAIWKKEIWADGTASWVEGTKPQPPL